MSCGDLIPFIDGELDTARADAFRLHLATCETCRVELGDEVQLKAHLDMLPMDDDPPTVPRAPMRERLAFAALVVLILWIALVGLQCEAWWAP